MSIYTYILLDPRDLGVSGSDSSVSIRVPFRVAMMAAKDMRSGIRWTKLEG